MAQLLIPIGAWLEDTGALNGGSAFVYSGATWLPIRSFHADAAEDHLGVDEVLGAAEADEVDRDRLHGEFLFRALTTIWANPEGTTSPGAGWRGGCGFWGSFGTRSIHEQASRLPCS